MPLVTVGIVSWNSAGVLDACLHAVRQQTCSQLELLVLDNASHDGSRAIIEAATGTSERVYSDSNLGFAGGHNTLIRRSRGDFYLALNPDVILDRAFISVLVSTLEEAPRVGAASGKLLRLDDPTILDSTGIVMLPSQRHLDRGAGQPDTGQYQRIERVFGASGAAAFYRRSMLEDIREGDEYFDEAFFAYREDADLAWRARLRGWECLYVPEAVAKHGRRVTPERRSSLDATTNRASVRNRFLLRIKNQPVGQALAFLGPMLMRDLQVIGYVGLREWSSLPAFADLVRLMPSMIAKRGEIMRRRQMTTADLIQWFREESRPWADTQTSTKCS